MKKIVLVFLALCALSLSTAQAQIRFGLKGGLNIASLSMNKDVVSPNNVTGFQVGPIMEVSFLGIGLETGVLYSQRGIDIESYSDLLDVDTSIGYLDIPLNLKYQFSMIPLLKPYLMAGPYVTFNVKGENISDQWRAKSFGAGLNFGAGVELFNMLQVGVGYELGLTDDYKTLDSSTDFTAKSRTWTISAAVFF